MGDYIVSFAGQEVSSTSEILTLRRDMQVGDLVPVRIWRNGEYLDLTMEMMAGGGLTPRGGREHYGRENRVFHHGGWM